MALSWSRESSRWWWYANMQNQFLSENEWLGFCWKKRSQLIQCIFRYMQKWSLLLFWKYYVFTINVNKVLKYDFKVYFIQLKCGSNLCAYFPNKMTLKNQTLSKSHFCDISFDEVTREKQKRIFYKVLNLNHLEKYSNLTKKRS